MVQIRADTAPVAVATEKLVDIVCSDVEFVRAEFAAIIEASWDCVPPVDDYGGGDSPGAQPGRERQPARSVQVPQMIGRPTRDIDRRTRERSPPLPGWSGR